MSSTLLPALSFFREFKLLFDCRGKSFVGRLFKKWVFNRETYANLCRVWRPESLFLKQLSGPSDLYDMLPEAGRLHSGCSDTAWLKPYITAFSLPSLISYHHSKLRGNGDFSDCLFVYLKQCQHSQETTFPCPILAQPFEHNGWPSLTGPALNHLVCNGRGCDGCYVTTQQQTL